MPDAFQHGAGQQEQEQQQFAELDNSEEEMPDAEEHGAGDSAPGPPPDNMQHGRNMHYYRCGQWRNGVRILQSVAYDSQ